VKFAAQQLISTAERMKLVAQRVRIVSS
jgi:hypothetical protein